MARTWSPNARLERRSWPARLAATYTCSGNLAAAVAAEVAGAFVNLEPLVGAGVRWNVPRPSC